MTPRLVARLALFAVAVSALSPARADDPQVVPAAKAKDHLDQPCVVEMTVRSSKDADRRKEIYLDSETDFRDPNNAVVVIGYDHLPAFRAAGIDEPAKHYLNRTIRVTGAPRKEGDQIRLRITDPKAIRVIEKVKKAS